MLLRGAEIVFDVLALAIFAESFESILLSAGYQNEVTMVLLRGCTGFFIERYSSLAASGPQDQIFSDLLLCNIVEIRHRSAAFDGIL